MDIATNVKELIGKRLLCRWGEEHPDYVELVVTETAGGEEGDAYVCVEEKTGWKSKDIDWMTKDRFLRRYEILEYLPNKPAD